MGLFDRISRVVRSNLNSVVNRAEDPEQVLEQTVQEMQADLLQLRQAVAQAIATSKRSERQLHQSQSLANQWQERAQLALQQGNEGLARDALVRRRSYTETVKVITAQLAQQKAVVTKLKQSMTSLETKIAEAKTRKDLFIARARAAQASQNLQETLGRVNSRNPLNAFDRMEERVQQLEAQAEVMAELSGDDLEQQFAALEKGSEVTVIKTTPPLPGEEPGKLPPGSRPA